MSKRRLRTRRRVSKQRKRFLPTNERVLGFLSASPRKYLKPKSNLKQKSKRFTQWWKSTKGK